MKNYKHITILVFTLAAFTSCKGLKVVSRTENKSVPAQFDSAQTSDTTNTAEVTWRNYFTDKYLISLIDTALANNQELNIIKQEIEISRNEVRARKGEYLPSVSGFAGAGAEKTSRYTRNGAVEANNEIVAGKEFPEPLQDYVVGVQANWEVDIWKKLRNAKQSAVNRYLSSIEGKNFMVTNLVSEIASEYYELISLDSKLNKLNQNIEIQNNALKIVIQQKNSAKVTELAVRRFEAQLFGTKSLKYQVEQKRIETENRINFLVGRFPQKVERTRSEFNDIVLQNIDRGLPSQLLDNRMDIRESELNLEASKLDVKVAKAKFYPSLGISADLGFQAFNPTYLIKSPESLLFSLAGDLVAPLINRNAIKADYYSANSRQIQAVYEYEKTILNAFIEVTNQLSKIENLEKSYAFKFKEVEALNQAISISNTLFKSARADYLEILLTQEERIESQFELIELKQQQLNAIVNTYRALGGGWN